MEDVYNAEVTSKSKNERAMKVKMEDKINYDLIGVVYEWACGKSFEEISKLTDVKHGLVVNTIRRLVSLI